MNQLIFVVALIFPLSIQAKSQIDDTQMACDPNRKNCHILECKMLKLNNDTKSYEITPVELKLRSNDDSGNGLIYLNGKFSHRRPDIDVDTEDHLKLVTDYFYFSVTGTSALQAVSELKESEIISLMPFYTYSRKKKFESTLRYFTTSAGWRGSPFMVEARMKCAY